MTDVSKASCSLQERLVLVQIDSSIKRELVVEELFNALVYQYKAASYYSSG